VAACLLITVPRFLHRRVPRLPAGHVSYDRAVPGLSIDCMAVQAAGFACLRGEVRAAVAEHLEPVLAGFGPRMRRHGRALWGDGARPLERRVPPPTRDRVSCCMFFTVRPEDTCATCPRTCDAGRVGKLRAAAAS
jgi:hypothetical protein